MKCITAGAGIDGADAGGNKFILEQAAVSAAPVLLDTCIVENQYIFAMFIFWNSCYNVAVVTVHPRTLHLLQSPYDKADMMGIRLFAAGKLLNEPDSVTGKPEAELLLPVSKTGLARSFYFMTDLKELLNRYMDQDFQSAVLSSPRNARNGHKIQLRPVKIKQEVVYQATEYIGTKVYHHNLPKPLAVERTAEWMEQYRQLQLSAAWGQAHVWVSKKGKISLKEKAGCGCVKQQDLSHNRKKQYILDPEQSVGFLEDLGVQTREGKIVKARYDKFRQINRFLEFIEDILPQLPRDREITILDFGCGKSYLTFAMYHYMKELKGLDVKIIGLDLKEDVIENCNKLAEKYGYKGLHFYVGDIARYHGADQVDMVVTLHACDTATDYALDKAIRWGAKVILSVPCCQHELNGQIQNDILEPVLRYGLLKERMAALFTDGLRAQILESMGYDVQILEFIDMEHTPKNILIRAVKRQGKERRENYRQLMDFLQVNPTLARLQEERTGQNG